MMYVVLNSLLGDLKSNSFMATSSFCGSGFLCHHLTHRILIFKFIESMSLQILYLSINLPVPPIFLFMCPSIYLSITLLMPDMVWLCPHSNLILNCSFHNPHLSWEKPSGMEFNHGGKSFPCCSHDSK